MKLPSRADLETMVRERLSGTDYELITLAVSGENEILVEVDRLAGVDVDFCAELNRYMVERLEAAGAEDYAIEVGSVSLTAPFKTKMQYEKNLGNDVEVQTKEGKKVRGQLVSVDEDSFAVDADVLVQVEGKKRKQHQIQTFVFRYEDAITRYELKV